MIMARTFTITSYGKTKEYPESQRKKMIKEFETAMLIYENILIIKNLTI